jgi:hypothetical protein
MYTMSVLEQQSTPGHHALSANIRSKEDRFRMTSKRRVGTE